MRIVTRFFFATALAMIAGEAAIAQQRATSIESWITTNDLPSDATARQGSARVHFTVTTDGRVTSCKEQFGHSASKDRICNLIEERARYVPAYAKSGQPIESKDEISVSWSPGNVIVGATDFGGALPANNPSYWATDQDLTPAIAAKTKVDVEVAFRIGPDGHISDCSARSDNSPEADRLTCRLLRSRALFHSPLGHDGNPIETVGRTVVHWRTPG
jgi:hypothetical protein